MFKILEYYGRFQGLKGDLGGLPGWGRLVIGVAALPGLLLIGLSILALLVSILALLLLTVPLYRLLRAVAGTADEGREAAARPTFIDAGEFTVATDPPREDDTPPVDEFPEPAPAGGQGVTEAVAGTTRRRQIDVKIIE